jgi:hypothetical protein
MRQAFAGGTAILRDLLGEQRRQEASGEEGRQENYEEDSEESGEEGTEESCKESCKESRKESHEEGLEVPFGAPASFLIDPYNLSYSSNSCSY